MTPIAVVMSDGMTGLRSQIHLWYTGDRLMLPSLFALAIAASDRYPLFGSALQHEIVYLAPTRNGEAIDYCLESLREHPDFEAWLARLVAQRVDLVVTLAPDTTPEQQWMRTRPELFELAAESDSGTSEAYRLNRSAAIALADGRVLGRR